MKLVIWFFLSVYVLTASVHGSKILVLVPFNGKSHWVYMQSFIKELLNRGHEITTVTSISMGDHNFENYTEILIDPPMSTENIIKDEDLFENTLNSPFRIIDIFGVLGNISADYALRNDKVKELIHSKDLHFDLILNEDIFLDAFLAFGHKFKAPIVGICPYGVPNNIDYEMGLLTPTSHVAHTVLSYSDKMSFSQRWYNTLLGIYDWYIRQTVHIPLQTQLIKEHFGHLEPLPSLDELRKNISVMFVNAHRSITYPRPSMPGLVYIGGANIKSPKPLPTDLQKFLDESNHGVIYLSFGTILKPSKMPKDKLAVFLDTFRRLKQRVIWKFEDESIPNLPANVLVRKWLPQTDILAHPNVVLFISHGGMFSNFEAINYGIQMLIIPFFSDQYRNALRTQTLGIGKHIDFKSMTNESFYSVLDEMVTDNKYSTKAKEISAIFRDNIVHPMDEFVWWIEHVIKFRGAKHLKSHAAEMSLLSYLLIDVLLLNIGILVLIIFGICYFVKFVSSKCISKSKKVATNKKTQ